MQAAVAIELFFITLLRSDNIRCLSYSRNFMRATSHGRPVMHLYIPADQVKNSIDLEILLGKYTTDLVRTYMTIYQPIMARGHNTDLLFPEPKSFLGVFPADYRCNLSRKQASR